jgi:hypothetical protein
MRTTANNGPMVTLHNHQCIQTTLNGSDRFSPASRAVRTVARHSFSLRELSPENSTNSIYL